MQVTTIGIDLAKNVFQIHGADERGKAVLRKQLRRDQVAPCFANLPPCLIGIEACGSAHHWARKLQALGHTVRLMAPQFVKRYVKSNKNDVADAEAICEAVSRPTMRFVPIKNAEQQSVLSLHRVRQAFVKARTAQANQIRGLLAEYGLIVPKGIGFIATRVPDLIEDACNELPGIFRQLIDRLLEHLKLLDKQVDEIEVQIKAWHRDDEMMLAPTMNCAMCRACAEPALTRRSLSPAPRGTGLPGTVAGRQVAQSGVGANTTVKFSVSPRRYNFPARRSSSAMRRIFVSPCTRASSFVCTE